MVEFWELAQELLALGFEPGYEPCVLVAPAKALKKFSDDVKPIKIKAAYVDGRVLAPSDIATLAAMPPKLELQAKLLGLLASPMRGFVGVLAANPSGFVRVLSAREKQLAEPTS